MIVVKITDSKLAHRLCSMDLRLIVFMSSVCVHRVSHWLFVTYSATGIGNLTGVVKLMQDLEESRERKSVSRFIYDWPC